MFIPGRKILLFGFLSVLSISTPAIAQDPTQAPLNGEIHLRGYITPDPYVVQMTVSGNYSTPSTLGSATCSGYITSGAPDLKFVIESGIPAHGVVVRGDVDTTLFINSPDGQWFCNDDDLNAGGNNPGIDFTSSPPGTYSIWVGTYTAYASATVTVAFTQQSSSSWSSLSTYPTDGVPMIGTARNDTVYMGSPISPDPYVMTVQAGGGTLVNDLGLGCVGYIAPSRPDVSLDFYSGGYLGIFVDAPVDTTLVINSPDGSWQCIDDSSYLTDSNPGWEFPYASPGVYHMWVGTYSENNNSDASLVFTQASTDRWLTIFDDPVIVDPVIEGVTPTTGPGRYANLDLVATFALDPHKIDIQAGGSSLVADLGAGCNGYLDASQPSVRLNFINGGTDLGIFAVDDVDSTLVINAPDGNWYCNDDSGYLSGTNNPGLLFENARAGNYHIWLAGYGESDSGDAMLVFTQQTTARWAGLNLGDPIIPVLGDNADSLEIDDVDVTP